MTKHVTDDGHHSAELLTFTIDPRTGRIVKLEGLNADGARRELTDDEKTRLIKQPRERTVERIVERAFEAESRVCSTGTAWKTTRASRPTTSISRIGCWFR